MLSVDDRPARLDCCVEPDLIFDVGLHHGEDTAYYLAKGYRVVGFEANPDLAQACRLRFADELAEGRLEIVEGAISDSGEATIAFFVHPAKSDWGTTDAQWVDRNARTTDGAVRRIVVPTIDFVATLTRTGMPAFMKIDIEGADQVCLHALRRFTTVPYSLSIESSKESLEALADELDLLADLGYTEFAAMQQALLPGRTISTRTHSGGPLTYTFERHSSGPFGDDIARWCDRDAILARYRRIFVGYRLLGDRSVIHRSRLGRLAIGSLQHRLHLPLPGWYDTHARRPAAEARPAAPFTRCERGGS